MGHRLPHHRSHGQSAAEYAVLLTAVVGALALMSFYIKHAVAGHWRSAADSIGEQYDPKHTTTKDDMVTKIESTTTTTSTLMKDQVLTGGVKADVMETTTITADDTTTKTGLETVGAGGSIWD